MDSNTLIEKLAGEYLSMAVEAVEANPLSKTASEADCLQAVADKLAEARTEAGEMQKVAEDQYNQFSEKEVVARQALMENGINPDDVINSAYQAATAAIGKSM